ncbi:MAG: pyruvate kinase [Verrucomicrobiota bacterium]
MKVIARRQGVVRCEVLTPGRLGSKRHRNLPGVHVKLPALTARDEKDLRAGIEFVALSFVRQADDIRALRTFLDSHGSPARIIATHPLENMIASPMPARREVSDASHSVRETADAFMLSGSSMTPSNHRARNSEAAGPRTVPIRPVARSHHQCAGVRQRDRYDPAPAGALNTQSIDQTNGRRRFIDAPSGNPGENGDDFSVTLHESLSATAFPTPLPVPGHQCRGPVGTRPAPAAAQPRFMD